MSIDIDVFPTVAAIPSWGDISRRLQQHASGPHPRLLDMQSKVALQDEDVPGIGHVYRLDMPRDNTLLLTLAANAGNLDEEEYLGDYGRNLDAATVRRLAQRWREAGWYWELTTMAGRAPQEPQLFVALGASLADACTGYVIVMPGRQYARPE